MLTHGERLLQVAEERARRGAARRRIVTLAVPGVAVTAMSAAALMGAQHGRIVASGGGALRHVVVHAGTIAFLAALVALPLIGAARTRRRLPAIVAFLAGPVASPYVLGSGGWRWWEVLVVGTVCGLVTLAGSRQRVGARPAAI